MKKLFYLSFLFFSLAGSAQNKLICDSLLHKDYDFWFAKADFIVRGQIIDIRERKRFSRYTIAPTQAFAGQAEEFTLRQNRTAKWFPFQPDTSYMFFVFYQYTDPIFSPCVLFGPISKMDAVIERYSHYCGTQPVKDDCLCNPYYDPVCGCDGLNYKNPCEAMCDGVFDYFRGSCLSTTPIKKRPEMEDDK